MSVQKVGFVLTDNDIELLNALLRKGVMVDPRVSKSHIIKVGLYALKKLNQKDFLSAVQEVPLLPRGTPPGKISKTKTSS